MPVIVFSFFALSFMLLAGEAAAQSGLGGRQEQCGFVYPVEAFEAEIDGVHIALTANDRLVVNGRVIAEYGTFDEAVPRPWDDSANGANIAVTQHYILVQTTWTDCIDYASMRIFVLDRETGALRTSSQLWSLHDRWSGFSETRAGLMFSSEWFCERAERPIGGAQVFVLRPGATEFVQEERSYADVCEIEEGQVAPRGRIYFADMRPVIPPSQ